MDLISVIIPIFQPKYEYLQISLRSLLNQTYKNIEILLIEDAPTGVVDAVLNEIGDSRIRHIKNEDRQGIAASLNKGILLSNGKYVARMDADDYALKCRLEVQYMYMESHPNIGICGAWSMNIETGDIINPGEIDDKWRIVKQIYENMGVLHPTVFFRKDFIVSNNLFYNENMKMAEDYELWTRCCEVSRLYTIPKVLLAYRIHEGQVSVSGHEREKKYLQDVHKRLLQKLNISDAQTEKMIRVIIGESIEDYSFIDDVIAANNKQKCFEKKYFNGELQWRIFKNELKNKSWFRVIVQFITIPQLKLARVLLHLYKTICFRFSNFCNVFFYKCSKEYRANLLEVKNIG